MLQYKIPSNVEVEDKIVGPLTLRQLIICGIGFGIAYIFYISLAKNYYWETWAPPVVIFCLLTIAIAFVEVRHVSFTKWVFLMLEAMINPSKRIWDKQESTRFLWATMSAAPPKPEKKEKKKEELRIEAEKKMDNLSEITRNLDILSVTKEIPDHELAASAFGEVEKLRHEARFEKQKKDEVISSIARQNFPVRDRQINTQNPPKPSQDLLKTP